MERDRQGSAAGGLGGSADAQLIRVQLPAHLRTLARVSDEVSVPVAGDATLGAVLDALESLYPVLQGTIRDRVTQRRRPFLRFYACQEDFSHEPPETPLPDEIVRGSEPLLVVG